MNGKKYYSNTQRHNNYQKNTTKNTKKNTKKTDYFLRYSIADWMNKEILNNQE